MLSVSREYGILPDELLERLDSQQLAEQMAYDMLQNDETRERIQGQIEIERSERMSPEDRSAEIRRMLRA